MNRCVIRKGGGVDGSDCPLIPISALLKAQWKSVNKFMTKKHKITTVATTKGPAKDILWN